MNEIQLNAKREKFCAAYERALRDPAFRVLLQHQPAAAMAQFGFSVSRQAGDAWPSQWKVSEMDGKSNGMEDTPPPV